MRRSVLVFGFLLLALATGAQPTFVIKALPANTGVMYIGSDGSGDVASTNGFPLSANEAVELTLPDTLAALWVDASVNGEKVAWLRVE